MEWGGLQHPTLVNSLVLQTPLPLLVLQFNPLLVLLLHSRRMVVLNLVFLPLVVPQEHLRVFDKIGRAYGFSIENAWIEDTRTGAGFFLAIVLYTNQDGVLNDDRYEYETVADPFLDAVGAAVARAVWPNAGPAGRR